MKDFEIIQLAKDIRAQQGSNRSDVVIVDMQRTADKHRFFIVDTDNSVIDYSWYTSHGKGSGPIDRCIEFSNVPESKKSSKGLMKTGSVYQSKKFGHALKLHGLEPGVNDNVFKRAIVIHTSDYVSNMWFASNKYAGRSWGCITLNPPDHIRIIERIKNGTLVYVVG